jgi:Icc-related predicted phosphoesterase
LTLEPSVSNLRKARRVIVLALVLLAGCASAERFYFVQISDTHWGARDGVSLTRRAAEMINALPVKVEFVVMTGDVCSDSILKEPVVKEGQEALKGLKAPLYYVPGNHDIVKTDSVRTSAQFEKTFGPLNRKVEVRGVMCLFLCTEMKEGETRPPAEVERLWIEDKLESGKSRKPVLIFMHRPPIFDMVNGSDGQVSWDHPYDTRWGSLFEGHPEIKGVFAGHFHREELRWIGGVPVFVAPALARFWDRQPSFRLFEYHDGQLNYWALYPERGSSTKWTPPSGARQTPAGE